MSTSTNTTTPPYVNKTAPQYQQLASGRLLDRKHGGYVDPDAHDGGRYDPRLKASPHAAMAQAAREHFGGYPLPPWLPEPVTKMAAELISAGQFTVRRTRSGERYIYVHATDEQIQALNFECAEANVLDSNGHLTLPRPRIPQLEEQDEDMVPDPQTPCETETPETIDWDGTDDDTVPIDF